MSNQEEFDTFEEIIEKFSKINLREDTMEAIAEQIKIIQDQMAAMNTQLAALDPTTKVEEFKEVQVRINDAKDISLDMYKTLPEFNGDRNKYIAWKNSAMNVMKIFNGHNETPRYFEALNIVRNKITGTASETLTNYNTVLNFDAIIARLDFTYADKRPIYIIEQEMIVLQQKNLSIEEFYDEVNKKLNALINKINMTHRERGIAEAMISDAADKALRTFVTGLTGHFGRILYASNPATLPEAYAKLQTIINDQERIKFANQYNQPKILKQEPSRMNPSFVPKPRGQHQTQQLPLKKKYATPTPMDIDHSTINVKQDKTEKRPRSGEFSNQVNPKKFQRVNHLNESSDESDLGEEQEAELNYGETDGDDTSSIFLD